MDIARLSIARPLNTWLLIATCLIGGVVAYFEINRLEDPSFTIPLAVVVTEFPGATAEEVELLVTELLESEIQQLKQVYRLTSRSRPGSSEITIEIADTYTGRELPQIWDELRRKVSQAATQLPSGAGAPAINDDFGGVAGVYLALTGPEYGLKDLHEHAKLLRRELQRVPGVARIDLAGFPGERIIVEVAQTQLAAMGLPPGVIFEAFEQANAIRPTGLLRGGDLSIRVAPGGAFETLQDVAELAIGHDSITFRLGDIATVRREYAERPDHIIRFNGAPAITLAIAARADVNVVRVGHAVNTRLAELQPLQPLGMQLDFIYDQPAVVDEAISSFMVSLALSVAIVVLALCVSMGWRAGFIVGTVLLLTVMGTLFVMYLLGAEMERISLGALIIAMGMLVDNAIVVCEGMLVRLQRGMGRIEAASAAVAQTRWPLLGATIVGVLAFAGIGLSPDSTGEFLASLFVVIAVSLLLSWVLAVTVTPLLGYYLLPAAGRPDAPQYDHRLFRGYRRLLDRALRYRWITLLALVAMLVSAVLGFRFVAQGFFPESNAPLLYVDFWLDQGVDIRATDRDARRIEAYLAQQPGVESVTTLVGAGAARFMLTYEPQMPDSSYVQFIVRTVGIEGIDALAGDVEQWLAQRFPDGERRVQRAMFGPGGGAKIEARFSGPDPHELRWLAAQAETLMHADGHLTSIRNDWRRPQLTIVPRLDLVRARETGLARADLLDALMLASDGLEVGAFREGDTQLPILVRAPLSERGDAALIQDRLLWSPTQASFVPLSEVTKDIGLENREQMIGRLDRARTLGVLADPLLGANTVLALARIRPAIEAIELPPGYRLNWGGEYEQTVRANESLARQMPVSLIGMLVVVLLLFGALRESVVIWLVVPMSIIGVTAGLLLTGMAFTFPALLGFIGLSGMLVKNAIVLIDEIHLQIGNGAERYSALLDASVARFRPILLASSTTMLGMIPLLSDRFFASMSVTIISGLGFGALLTVIAVPLFYMLVYRIRPAEAG